MGKKYEDAIVVFDSYEITYTKDMTHLRRTKGSPGITVTFRADMTHNEKRIVSFQNKHRFIIMLSEQLQKKNCETHYASGDDSLLTVKSVQSAKLTNTVLVDDDTDLLVLLCYHESLKSYDLFFCPQPKKNTKITPIWNIKATKKEKK